MKTLGDRIKYHRKRMGLTQEQLAERMGVSAQAVSKWEHNQSCPDITVLPSLAALFGISVDELLGNEVHQAEIVDDDRNCETSNGWHWEWQSKSIIFPIYIMVIGGLLLFNHFMGYDVSWWTVVWTSGVAFIGLSGLCSGFSLFSTMLVLGGAYFLLSAYEVFAWELSWSIVLPAALLLWGVSLLIDAFTVRKKKIPHVSGKKRRDYHCTNGQLYCDLSFGEHNIRATAPVLTGGTIDTSFGNFTVDLSGCERVSPDCTLSVDNSFGNLTLLVPKRFAAAIANDDNFASSAQFEGAPDMHPQGNIRILLDNSFGCFTVSYVDA